MSSRLRLACVCALLVTLPVRPLAAAVSGSPVDSNITTVDTLPAGPAPESGAGTPETLGIASISCGIGARLAFTNPWQFGGTGLALCLVGIYFEFEDFLHPSK